ncbi:TetR/AcrR family transcriptional regulator [Rhizobium sp. L1K21]|uniref:TetR/AcrR family transcriptional regulator n=1 Tax=Rhizobium sp. L1K21 TaxID=2954933 RepID=UPI002092AFC7|nr:TetR/AcrR family transcriptional regulator [Rhizobium sp. L1K21]MCO6185723.1 TetR/AcrR family transcriptional regulator [Rhizobium sp. L1K21]
MTARTIRPGRQARGQAHIQRILDSAAALIAQSGVDGLTMSAIGEAAGSAPGSLYQFFSNREALIEALAEREAAIVEACVLSALESWNSRQSKTPMSLMDALLPPLFETYQARPAWGELLHALARRGAPGDVEQALDASIQMPLAAALSLLCPQASADRCMLAAAMLLNFGHAGLLAACADTSGSVYGEVRRALNAYVTDWARNEG